METPYLWTLCDFHEKKDECKCICHEQNKIIMHDHACCSKCGYCLFKIRCSCSQCSPKLNHYDIEQRIF